MTTAKAQTADEAQADDNPAYRFSPALIEQQGRPLGIVLGPRLCDAGRARLKSALRDATWKELRAAFKTQCAGQEGYFSPQHPVVESVVRLLLVSESEALTLTDLREQLLDLWMQSLWPRHISRESLQRVLDRSALHGIERAASA